MCKTSFSGKSSKIALICKDDRIVGGASGCEQANFCAHPASVEMRDVVGFPHMLSEAGDHISPALSAFEDSDLING